MAPQLTSEELREPDVTISVSEREFYRLPANVQRMFQTYPIQPPKVSGADVVFVLPAYRWREIQEEMNGAQK